MHCFIMAGPLDFKNMTVVGKDSDHACDQLSAVKLHMICTYVVMCKYVGIIK